MILLDRTGYVVASSSRWDFYEAIVRAMVGLAEILAESQKIVPVETFAVRVYGRSKEFTVARRYALTRLLDSDLADLGLIEREAEIRIFGPVTWSVGAHFADGRATDCWLGVPGSVLENRDTFRIGSSQAILVENLTPFETLARECARTGHRDLLGLFGGGYLSSAEEGFLGTAIDAGLRDVGIWADMDPDGLLLAQDIIDLLETFHVCPTVVAMDPELFRLAPRTYPVKESRLELLAQNLSRLAPSLAGVAREILKFGAGVEQETILATGTRRVLTWADGNLRHR